MDYPEIIRCATYETKQHRNFPVHVRESNEGTGLQF